MGPPQGNCPGSRAQTSPCHRAEVRCPRVQELTTRVRPATHRLDRMEKRPTANLRHGDKDPSPSSPDHCRRMDSRRGGLMRRTERRGAARSGARAVRRCPAVASTRTRWTRPTTARCPTAWRSTRSGSLVAALLVIFMQAGFAFLEIGFSRARTPARWSRRSSRTSRSPRSCTGRSASPSRSATATIIGTHGFFLRGYGDPQHGLPGDGPVGRHDRDASGCSSSRSAPSRWRSCGARRSSGSSSASTSSTRSSSPALIYPIASHWVFGGGWLQTNRRHAGLRRLDGGAPDRRHRRPRGAAAARRAARQVRQRRQAAGDPGALDAALRPRRADPLARLVRLQPGLDARARWTAASPRSRWSRCSRPPPACSAPIAIARWKTGTIDIGMAGNGAIGALVAITAPSGYVEPWAAPIIGAIAGVIVAARRVRDRQEDRRPGRRAHRARPVRRLGHARVRHLHVAAAGRVQRGRRRRA